MAEPTLPTEEELEKLYRLRGKDALVWYAWRNALRALPVLGRLPLQVIWEQKTVIHAYHIVRVVLFLAQRQDALRLFAAVAAATAAHAVTDAAYSTYAAASDAVVYAAYAAYANDEAYAIYNAYTSVKAVDDPDKNPEDTYYATYVATNARADYDALCSDVDFEEHWLSLPLWQFTTNINEPLGYEKLQTQLKQNLIELGLDFLAEDLDCLWNNKPLGKHAVNYFKDISEADISDPATLRRIILGETEVEYIHAVRVLLLGSGGSGKSTLADRLQGKPVKTVKLMTVGVDYLEHKPLNLKKTFPHLKLDDQQLDLFLWDFGGQTIFHGLHSAFLHENCVYVLVVDSRHEQAPDEWLHQIRHLAGSQAKVLLVTNWYEHCETRQNETRLLREFPNLLTPESFFYFSCLDAKAKGFLNFVESLVQAALDSQKAVAKETFVVYEKMRIAYKDGIFLKSHELKNLIKTITQRDDSGTLIPEKLHQLGRLVQVDEDKRSYCLNPTWAVDQAYKLIYSKQLKDEAQGILAYDGLEDIFEDELTKQYVGDLLGFLQYRSLCRKLDNINKYFFPDAAPANEPKQATQLLRTQSALRLSFDLPYLPLGFHARLVNQLFNPNQTVTIQNTTDIWRQGFILRKAESQAVVHYLLRKNTIEVVFVGAFKDFGALLDTLYVQLKNVLISKNALREDQIQPFVSWDQQIFSVHSTSDFIDVLKRLKHYDQLIGEVKKMASKVTNNYGDTFHNDLGNSQGAQINNKSDYATQNNKFETLVNTDQRQIISNIFDELYKHKDQLDSKVVRVVRSVQNVLEEDAEQPTQETQSKLSKVTDAMGKVVDLTDKSIDVATKVADKWPAITSALAGIGTALGIS